MQLHFEFYATLRDAVGEKSVVRTVPDGVTVADALRAVAEDYDGLQSLLFRENGALRSHITVARNDQPLLEDRDDVVLSEGDTLVLSPGVSGGTATARLAEASQ
ncbi:molybdopterin synthase sulfur carrier subunit [Natronomonas sp. CBA1123]|jgi:molybdopterin converting factor small subunit|uniref:ubiquitin-like small modifier protein 1 n=1 Tax=Natronomonas sp. CBA1123 TaxID=2668070 RepID=UPI0012EA125A|nr:ubiquitin-like small modifier protein 1 [Natronomonas sp. CBA1123]MUV86736.1 molybdopterin synthase sulfur carrier subunit [Natronomonas sp. CBA1123]